MPATSVSSNSKVERMQRLENRAIPVDFDYDVVLGLRNEALQKLSHFRPSTLGQAARIQGVNPADISLLLVQPGTLPPPGSRQPGLNPIP